jgi:signal transduction histidine kinase
VRISDQGPGIPSAHRQQVFDKFHRVDTSLTARQQGSGLGLSIARQLAEGLGGALVFCPGSNGGACFELTVPMGGEA